ncbi:hypothetical protein [Nonomuraea soli]|uniref:Uncharacterized protein n=1 Tax=Nonomuraea soli TaxID=1032476 RepID=A0A7W0HVX0_9ACTN|nr:hypothetical protein [Nonomuraea soli]MBA2897669.1 hypothetical protein [Nonomuraea soli]
MGRLEDLLAQFANDARYELSQALTPVCSLDDEGKLGDHDLGRIADRYHLMTWWQEVTDLTHGIEEAVDGGTAILTVRQRARRYLLEVRVRAYGSASTMAMAESRRASAQTFLDQTRQLADALTPPLARGAHPANDLADELTDDLAAASADNASGGPAVRCDRSGAEASGAAREYRP